MSRELDVVRFLLEEIEREQDRRQRYEKAEAAAHKKADKEGGYYWTYLDWDEPFPVKARIAENCKMARRLLSDIARVEGGL